MEELRSASIGEVVGEGSEGGPLGSAARRRRRETQNPRSAEGRRRRQKGRRREGDPPGAIWRLQLCLAALYSGVGDGVRARLAATIGQEDAVRAGSRLGQERASELLVRLSRFAAA